ncbi:hypothetical protein BJX63DRAFT_424897 [Aspergillus granulosus]|uniref:Zn(2)-C6 fungal-type domain-containing protein n=1 Tax=Aspergillus granulosus TaxID=176169 RepID=A0ABR4GY38_9EURO
MPEMADMPAPMPSPVTGAPPRPTEDLPLRNSCGNCNQAKVRCSKDRPTCRRCASRNTPCVYGVSLRGMKRPRAEAQLAEARQPEKKKRATSLPSPVLSEALPPTTVDVPGQAPFFPDWNSDLYTGSFVNDGLSALLPLNTFDTSLVDQGPFPFPLGDVVSSPSPPFQSFASSHMGLPPVTIPLSPISPPASRDSHLGTLSTAARQTSPGSCCCQQTIGYKLAELKTPKQQGGFVMDAFLKEHRANMALCTAVLECSAEQHRTGMMLLVEIIALLFHMVAAFDQILQQKDKTQVPTTCPPQPPSEHRKEQVTQANILRAELAKLGALIQDFDRRYCTLDSTSWGEDTFLLSPLFVNLQWKTQSRFDSVRSWIPWL